MALFSQYLAKSFDSSSRLIWSKIEEMGLFLVKSWLFQKMPMQISTRECPKILKICHIRQKTWEIEIRTSILLNRTGYLRQCHLKRENSQTLTMTSKLDNAIERLGCSTVISKEALNDGSSKHGLYTKLKDF